MPWTPSEAEEHTKAANTPRLRQLWADVANRTLEKHHDDARAIREANAVVARAAAGHSWV